MPIPSREIRLAARPRGAPVPTDFELAEVEVPDPGEGEILIRNAFVSVDPYMRGRMNDVKSYVPPFQLGEPMIGGAVGQVVASRNERFDEGAWVVHGLGWREFALSDGRGVLDRRPLPRAGVDVARRARDARASPRSSGIARHRPASAEGETVFVSGAAGAVGSARRAARAASRRRVIGSAGYAREGRLARGARVRRSLRLSGDVDAGRTARARARRDRRVLRQRRRRDARGRDRGDAPPRPRRRLRLDLALQRDGGAARPAQPLHGRHQAAADRRASSCSTTTIGCRRSSPRSLRWSRTGRSRYRETIVDGIENAPRRVHRAARRREHGEDARPGRAGAVRQALCRVFGHRVPESKRFFLTQRRARCSRCGKRVRVNH